MRRPSADGTRPVRVDQVGQGRAPGGRVHAALRPRRVELREEGIGGITVGGVVGVERPVPPIGILAAPRQAHLTLLARDPFLRLIAQAAVLRLRDTAGGARLAQIGQRHLAARDAARERQRCVLARAEIGKLLAGALNARIQGAVFGRALDACRRARQERGAVLRVEAGEHGAVGQQRFQFGRVLLQHPFGVAGVDLVVKLLDALFRAAGW